VTRAQAVAAAEAAELREQPEILRYARRLAAGRPPLPRPEVIAKYFARQSLREMVQAGSIDGVLVRDAFTRDYAFAIPCREAVEAFRRSKAVLELGCGTGFWARVLAAAGIDVIATDHEGAAEISNHLQRVGGLAPKFEPMAASEAVARYPDRDVLLCWPYFTGPSEWDFEAVSRLAPGRLIYYIGEGRGGITGTPRLHAFLGEGCRIIDQVEIPQFHGIRDGLTIYEVA
jgi:hypothetical protein